MTSAEKTRAAVVGAGLGGLAVAIRLQAAGVRTTLFEALDEPGGRAGVLREAGFSLDTGPTVLTAPHCIEELFALAGKKLGDHLELLPVKPFYRLAWFDGDHLDYGLDLEATLAQIRARNPADADGYLRFLDFSRKNFEAGYTELVSTAFLRPWDMLRVAPKLMLLRSDRPVYATISKFIRDEKLRQALSFHTLLIGGSPFETSSIYTLIHYLEREWGVHYPRGGTAALVQALARLFTALGGELRLGCPVHAIRVVDGAGPAGRHRVSSAAGTDEPFDLTVSNADLMHTYARLLEGEPRARPMQRKLQRMHWSMSLFIVYLGLARTWPELRQHTILFGPRYRALIDEIFHGHALPADFSLYVHAPTATDPSLAPPGSTGLYVLSPVPHLGQAELDWEREGPAYAERILAALEAALLPGLREHVVFQRLSTPCTFRDRLGAHLGNGFSVAPLLTQSAYLRPHNRDPRIPGLYAAGAGTHPGAGVPGVVNSARATARVILADLGLPAQPR
jgi:phytoene desaturase